MNAYNPLASMKRLEDAGLARSHAEAIATEITEGGRDLVTKAEMDAALDKQTIKISVIIAGMLTLACTVVTALVSVIVTH